MRILIAEDEQDISTLYKIALEKRNHKVVLTSNGEDCLKAYNDELYKNTFEESNNYCCIIGIRSIFDVVVLDYRMPAINGLEVAKEILAINPHQRIIFASAYVKETLEKSIKQLKQIVELMQKPFSVSELIETIEDIRLYNELKKLNVDTDIIKAMNPTHEQVMDLLEKLKGVEKVRAF